MQLIVIRVQIVFYLLVWLSVNEFMVMKDLDLVVIVVLEFMSVVIYNVLGFLMFLVGVLEFQYN